eukprot:22138_1
MGSCLQQGTNEEREINQQINSRMRTEKKEHATSHRILLLGPGDSGKTTILKQMRRIHSGTIPEDTIDSYSNYIRSKVISYIKILCKESLRLKIALDTSKHTDIESSRQHILDLSPPCDIDTVLLNHMKALWANKGIQDTLSQREKFQIPDNVSYFFDQRLDDIASEDYTPSFDDYLRIRMRTTGFNEESFKTYFSSDGTSHIQGHAKIKSANNTPKAAEYKDLELDTAYDNTKKPKGVEHTFVFMDVGGQRAERKKWMNMLQDDIESVVYVIAISEYDLMCFEDSSTLRLTEALNLFETVLEKGFMKGKTVTLFFNKYDLLLKKLADMSKTTIKDHYHTFPDDRDPRNPEDVCNFVYELFAERFERVEKSTTMPHYHKTSALDTDQIQNVMSDIQSDLIRRQLRMAGF